jgi:hypothetical protein
MLCASTVDHQSAIGVLIQATDNVQHGGFTAAGGAKDRHKLTAPELKVYSPQGFNLTIACRIFFCYAF